MPWARRTFQTKDVSGISLGMYSAFTLGVALWLAYGLMLLQACWWCRRRDLALALGILAMKLIYQRARNWIVGVVAQVDVARRGHVDSVGKQVLRCRPPDTSVPEGLGERIGRGADGRGHFAQTIAATGLAAVRCG